MGFRTLARTMCVVVFLDAALLFAIVPLLPAYSRSLDLTKAQAGIVVGAYSAAVLLAAFPVGRYADRLGARRLTIAGIVLLAVSTGAYAFAFDFWTLFVARVGQGVSSAISWTAGLAWLSSAAPVDARGRALGLAMSAGNLGALLGPVIGGVVGHQFGIRAPFALCALLAALVTPAVVRLPEVRVAADRHVALRTAVTLAARTRLIAVALVVTLVVALVSGAMETLVPLALGREGWTALGITVVFTVAGVIATVTNYTVGRLSDRVGRVPIAAVGLVASAVGAAAMGLATTAEPLVLLYLAVTPAVAALYAIAFPLGSDGADEAAIGHGTVLGLINLAWGLGFMLGPAAGAAVAEASSDAVTYFALGLLALGAGLWVRLAVSPRECQEPA